VLGDEQERSIGKSLFVHGLESGSGIGWLFKADESRVLGLVALYVSRLDLSMTGEHRGELSVISSCRESLDEEVSELSFSSTSLSSLVLGLVEEHLDLFSSKDELVLFKLEDFLSHFGGLE